MNDFEMYVVDDDEDGFELIQTLMKMDAAERSCGADNSFEKRTEAYKSLHSSEPFALTMCLMSDLEDDDDIFWDFEYDD